MSKHTAAVLTLIDAELGNADVASVLASWRRWDAAAQLAIARHAVDNVLPAPTI